MKKAVWSAAAAAAILMYSTSAYAQAVNLTQTLTATATVGNQAKLTVSGSISFPDTDPDVPGAIPNSGGPVSIAAKARVAPTTPVTLTVVADKTHFDDPGTTIPVGALKWTSSGGVFNGTGTMANAAQSVGFWTGPANHSGTQTYTLDNSWAYAPGTYSVTLTYTLSTP